MLFPAN